MTPIKTFKVFGEPIEVLIPGEMTGGRSTTLTKSGGPEADDDHTHMNEDKPFLC